MYGVYVIIVMLALLWITTRRMHKKAPSMFSRYDEKARRAIFCARARALQMGSPVIGPEHLLLGLIHEENTPARSFLLPDWNSWFEAEVRQRIETHEPLSTKTEIPLNHASKRILAYAAEEAKLLSHKHIGTEHLLLGLLRERPSVTTELLEHKNICLEKVRGAFKS